MIFFNLSLLTWQHILVLFLGTYGFAAVGTVFSAMAVNTRAREVMLPILLFPVLLPVLVAGVKMTGALMDGESLSSIANWLQLVVDLRRRLHRRRVPDVRFCGGRVSDNHKGPKTQRGTKVSGEPSVELAVLRRQGDKAAYGSIHGVRRR